MIETDTESIVTKMLPLAFVEEVYRAMCDAKSRLQSVGVGELNYCIETLRKEGIGGENGTV